MKFVETHVQALFLGVVSAFVVLGGGTFAYAYFNPGLKTFEKIDGTFVGGAGPVKVGQVFTTAQWVYNDTHKHLVIQKVSVPIPAHVTLLHEGVVGPGAQIGQFAPNWPPCDTAGKCHAPWLVKPAVGTVVPPRVALSSHSWPVIIVFAWKADRSGSYLIRHVTVTMNGSYRQTFLDYGMGCVSESMTSCRRHMP